jgi:hypothetical protein
VAALRKDENPIAHSIGKGVSSRKAPSLLAQTFSPVGVRQRQSTAPSAYFEPGLLMTFEGSDVADVVPAALLAITVTRSVAANSANVDV